MSGGWRAPVTPHPATTVGGGIGSVLKGMQLSASLWHSLCVGQVPHTQRLPHPARPLLAWLPRVSLPVGSGLSYVGRMSPFRCTHPPAAPGLVPQARGSGFLWHSIYVGRGRTAASNPARMGAPSLKGQRLGVSYFRGGSTFPGHAVPVTQFSGPACREGAGRRRASSGPGRAARL